jgi:putative FmdB family regulatory protein
VPLFDYKCSKCGTFNPDVFTKYGSTSKVFCKSCGEAMPDEDKQISSSNFNLKGGGWANDGYAPKKENKYQFQD